MSERFIESVANRERVCTCICPAERPQHRDICMKFIGAGELLILERVGERYSARCLACAKALGYEPWGGIELACPACGAEPGQPCRLVGGGGGSRRVLAEPHVARGPRTTAR